MTGRRAKDQFRLTAEDFDPILPVESTLSGSIDTIRVAAPVDVRINGGRLEWIPGSDKTGWWPDGGKASQALWAFIDLAISNDNQKVLEFARRYGVLGLTSSGVPDCGSSDSFLGSSPQLSEPWQGWATSWEPLDAYRLYARGMRAMVALAVALKEGIYVDPARLFRQSGIDYSSDSFEMIRRILKQWQLASPLDWETWWELNKGDKCDRNLRSVSAEHIVENFTFSDSRYDFLTMDEKAHAQRRKFGFWLTRMWLERSGLAPVVDWEGPSARLCLSLGPRLPELDSRFGFWPVNSLFRVLVAHLIAIARGGVYAAACSHCGAIYYTSRRARIDQPGYCSNCRATAGSRRTQKWRDNQTGSHPNLTPTHTPTATNEGEQ